MCRILFRQSPFGQILRIVISGSSAGKESVCNARDCCSISGSRRAPGEGIRYPLQYSWASLVAQMVNNSPPNAGDAADMGLIPGLGRSTGRGTAIHSSILIWRIPWTKEPGGLLSMGSQRVRHNWAMQETKEMQVESLEEEMATYSNILAWKIPWTEESGGL